MGTKHKYSNEIILLAVHQDRIGIKTMLEIAFIEDKISHFRCFDL